MVFAARAGLFALVFSWVLSSPGLVPLINWDSGSYIALIATGGLPWSSYPWNAHIAVGQEFLIGTWVARLFGGTIIDGFRLTSAVAFAVAFAAIADTLRVVTRSRIHGALLALAWATAWVNLHYHLLIEDNWLVLAPAALALRLCVLHASDWRPRHSLSCGLFVAAAFLGSWQGVPYLAPTMLTAALAGSNRRLFVRGRDAAIVPAAFLVGVLLWMLFFVATSDLNLKRLLAVVFSRPQPSALPETFAQFKAILTGGVIFDVLGTGVAYHTTFSAYKLSTTLPLSLSALGKIALGVQGALFAACSYWTWRRRDIRPFMLSGVLLLLTLVVSLYKDEAAYAELKRFDFVPLFLVLLAGCALGARKMPSRAVIAGLILLAVAQTALGVRWALREKATYVTTRPWAQMPPPPTQVYGREGQSWFGYFRGLRRAHPQACTFVFVVTEFNSGFWNFDMVGALLSELPDHLALEHPGHVPQRPVDTWRYRIKHAPADKAQLPACAWLSDDARKLLQLQRP